MPSRSYSTEAIILKRRNVGEADRVVTLLSRDQGKLTCIAKGARKMSSSKRAYLEPGNYIKCQLISTQSMPLMTQATLITDCHQLMNDLPRIRQLTQLLEIIDAIFVEEQMEDELFEDVLTIRQHILGKRATSAFIRSHLEELIIKLGYQDPKETKYASILEYVSVLADKPMKSWEYLKVE